MNLLWFILFAIIIFLATLIGYKKYFSTCLYALAIGGVVNSNFFTSLSHGIDIFGYEFGIDSIIYTLFIFCVILMFLRFDKKQAYILSISSCIAIALSGLLEFLANVLSGNYSSEVLYKFIAFIFSSLASIIAIILMIDILSKLKKKNLIRNEYLLTIIGIFIATVVNSTLYYQLAGFILYNHSLAEISEHIITSIIGKSIALLAALFSLFIIRVVDKRFFASKESVDREN